MTQILLDMSNALIENVKAVGPSLVRIETQRRSPASGIVWSAEGLIITAHHVLKHKTKIRVGLPDDQVVAAELVGRDPSTDLALLRVEVQELAPPAWVESDGLAVGHLILALGRPGSTVQATLGIISALGGAWRTRHSPLRHR